MEIQAAVLRGADAPYSIETVDLAEPGYGQIRIRIAGAGMCHTDMMWRLPGFGALPAIPGHEGAGTVDKIGPGVDELSVGDHVVLTFDSCGTCSNCFGAHPAYCDTFWPRNLTGRDPDGQTLVRDTQGAEISARWFQQSSFATHALATARNAVKVPDSLPLHLLGPLGCAVQTGAGAVFNTLKVTPGASFLVLGAGAVGLSALMAARVAGADPIVAVDRHPSRLQLARDLGATHTLNTDDGDLSQQLRTACATGVQTALDTTGVPAILNAAIGNLRPRGILGLVAAQAGDLTLAPTDLAVGRTLTGIFEGDAVPQQLIPLLIRLWQQGRFPFDKLIKTYPLNDINEAEKAANSGDVVKPVLLCQR